MVRLKEEAMRKFRGYGISFNSTMVRLKAVTHIQLGLPLLGFNSTMVRLKVRLITAPGTQSPSFNSTMVRLKETQLRVSHATQ